MRIDIAHETAVDVVATWDQVVILATRTALTLEALRSMDRAVSAGARERPTCVLTVFGQRTQLPDSEMLRAAATIVQASAAHCGARVVPGRGLWATALRGMANAPELSAVPDRPRKTFNSIDEATTWLGTMMGRDAPWRSQLSTITGTLVYGSPSWRRDSQMVEYMSNDGSTDPSSGA